MSAAVGLVAVLQAGIVAAGSAVLWLAASGWAGLSFIAGGACAVAGTAAYGLCLAVNRRTDAGPVLRAHVLAQTAKVAVAATLLIAGLNSKWEFAAGAYVAGFIAAVLAYPFALLLVNTKTDRN